MMRRAIAVGKLAYRARSFHSSKFAAKLVVENVPALGESITEGTIASWAKAEGDKIAVDDVIVIVETDKVTVDIKSTHSGVLTKKIAVDNVVVGAPLYEMDTDGAASSPAPAASTEAAAPAATPAATATSGHAHDEKHRTPLIKFIGKRDKAQKAPVVHSSPTAPAAKAISTPAPAVAVREGNGVHFTSLKGMGLFGRPALTLKEMEAVESGGATL